MATGYVNSGNNHHLAVYERPDGTLFDRMFTFQEVFAARAAGLPVYQQTCEDGVLKWKFEQNDVTVFKNEIGLDTHYRVQKLSKLASGQSQMFFRLITETKVDESELALRQGRFIRITSLGKLNEFNPRYARISILGQIND